MSRPLTDADVTALSVPLLDRPTAELIRKDAELGKFLDAIEPDMMNHDAHSLLRDRRAIRAELERRKNEEDRLHDEDRWENDPDRLNDLGRQFARRGS